MVRFSGNTPRYVDIVARDENAVVFNVEVKTNSGRVRPSQRRKDRMIEEGLGIYNTPSVGGDLFGTGTAGTRSVYVSVTLNNDTGDVTAISDFSGISDEPTISDESREAVLSGTGGLY